HDPLRWNTPGESAIRADWLRQAPSPDVLHRSTAGSYPRCLSRVLLAQVARLHAGHAAAKALLAARPRGRVQHLLSRRMRTSGKATGAVLPGTGLTGARVVGAMVARAGPNRATCQSSHVAERRVRA